jgi:predicted permease
MGTFFNDIRYGLRTLGKNAGFTTIAVLTLALGIGANTALFSVVNGVLMNQLPFPQPEQIVTLHESKANFQSGSISYPNFRDWQKDNRTFSSMAIIRRYGFTMTGMGAAEQVNGMFITSDLFSLLGVTPVAGRTFVPGEDEIGRAPIAIISEGLWKRKFGGAQDALGKNLTLDGKDYAIVGIIPANFDVSLRNTNLTDVYAPIGQWSNPVLPNRGAGLGIHGIGRLKAGVTLAQAKDDMNRVTANLATAYPDVNKGIGATLIPMKELVTGKVRPYLLALLAAVGFVLLIACVNVGNLVLARSTSRSREMAIRSSLGAGQTRLMRQLLTESFLLAIAGGGLGLLLAAWGTKAVLSELPLSLPRAGEVGLDARVMIFTAAVSLLAGIVFGLAPALKTAKPQLHELLKEGGRGGSGARHRAHGIYVVVEMAMALVLLIGAGLMLRSLAALWNVNPGFNPKGALTFGLTLPPSMMKAKPDAIRAALREVDAKLKTIPGLTAASLSWGAFPLTGDDEQLFWLEGHVRPSNPNDMNWALSYVVEPDYLKAMGVPLLQGRFFSAQDNEHAPAVAVVDDVFAAKFFPNQNPLGKTINLDSLGGNGFPQLQIIGVVGHVKQWGLDSDDTNELRAQMYAPYMQLSDGAISLAPSGTTAVVRSEGNAQGLFTSIREAVQQINSENSVYSPQTLEEIISGSIVAQRFSMELLGAFAVLALLLASIGIYGVVSYLVGQRTHEIGVRIALGAQRGDVMRLVLEQGARMTLIGVAVGSAAALGLTKLLANYSLLFKVSATDPLAFAAAATVLTIVALAACYIPARRATRVDPMVALRYE